MRSVRMLAAHVGISVLVVVTPVAGAAGDIYVDDSHLGPFLGTPTNPFKTIHDAIISPAVSDDTIHVASGTYNAALGEVFPIEVPEGVTIEGPPTGSLPVIGGDLIDEEVPATSLVQIVTTSTTGDISGIELRRLRFLGENETEADSPIALRVIATNGNDVTNFVFEYNECTRPAQNDGGENGWSAVRIEVQDAEVGGFICNNSIEVSQRGGIEIIAKATSSTAPVQLNNLHIDRNYVTNVNGSTALFGIAHHAIDGGSATVEMYGPTSISGNTVRGRGEGIWNGIEVMRGAVRLQPPR